MKKKFWMLGMAVMALASCTQNEVLDVPESRVIGFEPFVNKSTRAAIQIQQNQTSDYTGDTAPSDNLYQFWVLAKLDGDELFNGTDKSARVYYKNAPTSGFTYDNHKAWQNGTYSFAAYSNGNHPLKKTGTGDTVAEDEELNVTYSEEKTSDVVTGSKLTFADYEVGSYDLLAAIAKTETLTNPATATNVPFTFKHMLSCIHITLENASTNLYLQIGNIEFKGVKKAKCEFTYSEGTNSSWDYKINWTPYTTEDNEEKDVPIKDDYLFEGTGINADDASNETVNSAAYIAPNGGTLNMRYFVIPQSNESFNSIKLNVKSYTYDKDGTPKFKAAKTGDDAIEEKTISLAISGEHNSWKPGYQYNYRGSLTGDAHWIHFTVKPTENWITTDAPGSVIVK